MPKISAERAARQRERILDAAVSCFAKRGVDATTMRDIFQRSGLTAGAVYGYFDSKQELIEAVARRRHDTERELLQSAQRAADPLEAFLDGYFDHLLGPDQDALRRVTVAYWASSLHDPALHAVAREGLEPVRRVAPVIAEQQAAGKLRDDLPPTVLARLITSLLQGAVLQLCWSDDIDVAEYRDALATILRPADVSS